VSSVFSLHSFDLDASLKFSALPGRSNKQPSRTLDPSRSNTRQTRFFIFHVKLRDFKKTQGQTRTDLIQLWCDVLNPALPFHNSSKSNSSSTLFTALVLCRYRQVHSPFSMSYPVDLATRFPLRVSRGFSSARNVGWICPMPKPGGWKPANDVKGWAGKRA
jgi:hypothetical protein